MNLHSLSILRLVTVLEEVAQISFKSNRVSTERKNRIAGDPEVVSRSVYTSGLAWSTGEDSLIAHFSQAGAVCNKFTFNLINNQQFITYSLPRVAGEKCCSTPQKSKRENYIDGLRSGGV